MRVSVLTPYRIQHGTWRWLLAQYTDKLWVAVGEQLRRYGHHLEVVRASDDLEGPFSRARALNNARRLAAGDVLLIADADDIPPPVGRLIRVLEHLVDGTPWECLYDHTAYIDESTTRQMLAGNLDPWTAPIEAHMGHYASGLALLPSTWDTVGGFDERFVGWGCEDSAFLAELRRIPGGIEPGDGAHRSLWHDPQSREHYGRNSLLLQEHESR